MDNSAFFVAPYPARKSSPWKLEIRARFAGKKIRRFFKEEEDARFQGLIMTGQIQERGVLSLESTGATVARVLAQFWRIRGDSFKGRHERTARYVLNLFGKRYGRLGIEAVGTKELSLFWDRPEWPDGKSARWQAFTYLRIFFNWAERYNFVDRNPIRKVDPPKRPGPLRDILDPDTMATLLSLEGHHLAFVCLGGFAGLRSSEALRVDCKRDLNWKQREIRVAGTDDDGNVTGFEGERYVKMLPAFVRHCPKKFKFPNERNFYAGFRNALVKIETVVPQNALRHSWFTYHLAKFKNASLTAHEGGNTEKMVTKVYALPSKRARQAAWWKL